MSINMKTVVLSQGFDGEQKEKKRNTIEATDKEKVVILQNLACYPVLSSSIPRKPLLYRVLSTSIMGRYLQRDLRRLLNDLLAGSSCIQERMRSSGTDFSVWRTG